MRWLCVSLALAVCACGRGDAEQAAAHDAGRTVRPPLDAASAVDAGPIPIAAPTGAYHGADCSAGYAPRPDRDPNPMCFAPGGTFEMGAPAGKGDLEDGPQRQVTLSPFFVDEYEVTLAQYAAFMASREGKAIGCDVLMPDLCPTQHHAVPAPPFLVDTPPVGQATTATATLRVPPGRGQDPATDVPFSAAVLYCAWAGKALPTEAQWEYAAGHDPVNGEDHAYPWGDRFEAKRANCDDKVCKDGFPIRWDGDWKLGLSPVGSFDGTNGRKDGRSPIGIHDASGNAEEWVAGCFREHVPAPDCGDCRDPAPRTDCDVHVGEVFASRGGAYEDERLSPVWSRSGSSRAAQNNGFRCVTRSAPPRADARQNLPQ